MLASTFCHLPGIGPNLERRLWNEGILTWDDFLAAGRVPGLSPFRLDRLKLLLDQGRQRLDDPRFWSGILPPAEHWRLYGRFKDRAAALDIETTGLSAHQGGEVTLVGLSSPRTGYLAFVSGRNLDDFEAALDGVELLITFNGACFDLPFLRASVRHLDLPPGHVDLRFALRRLGLRGGLKVVEETFGLFRPPSIYGLDGFDAVILWQEYLSGRGQALDRLIEYNRADTENLIAIMDQAFPRLRRQALAKG